MEPAPGSGLGLGDTALARPKRANIRTTAYTAAAANVELFIAIAIANYETGENQSKAESQRGERGGQIATLTSNNL